MGHLIAGAGDGAPWVVASMLFTTLVSLVVAIWRALVTGKLVLGTTHNEIKADRDWWRATARGSVSVAERAVGITTAPMSDPEVPR